MASVACRILATTESDICIKNSVRILYICCNSVCVNYVMDPLSYHKRPSTDLYDHGKFFRKFGHICQLIPLQYNTQLDIQ